MCANEKNARKYPYFNHKIHETISRLILYCTHTQCHSHSNSYIDTSTHNCTHNCTYDVTVHIDIHVTSRTNSYTQYNAHHNCAHCNSCTHTSQNDQNDHDGTLCITLKMVQNHSRAQKTTMWFWGFGTGFRDPPHTPK